jgi:hypothetical protein
MGNGQSGMRPESPRDSAPMAGPAQPSMATPGRQMHLPGPAWTEGPAGAGGARGCSRSRGRQRAGAGVIVTTARIQATYLGGSRSTGTYGQRGARPGYTPPALSTPGLGTSGAEELRRSGGTGGGPGTCGATSYTRRWRRWRTGAGGHQGSPRQESWTGCGADRARTRRAGVYALLDWHNLPGRVTRGAGSDGPPTKMYCWRSFYLMCR